MAVVGWRLARPTSRGAVPALVRTRTNTASHSRRWATDAGADVVGRQRGGRLGLIEDRIRCHSRAVMD